MRERRKYLDILRIAACICVVMVHVSGMWFSALPVTESSWHIVSCYDIVGILGVPLFVMISGALMLDQSYCLSGKKLTGKLLHLTAVYFFWMLLYNLQEYVAGNTGIQWENFKEDVLLRTLTCVGKYHLWFLPMMMALYLACPLLKQIVKEKKNCEYFLILGFILIIFFPTAFKFNFRYQRIVESMYNTLPLGIMTNYAFYFVLGHYLDTYVSIRCRQKYVAEIGAVFGVAVTAVLCSLDAVGKGTPSTLMNDPFTLGMLLTCICIWLIVKTGETQKKLTKTQESPIEAQGKTAKPEKSVLQRISGLTFGVYLIHPFCIMAFTGMGWAQSGLPVIVRVPVYVLLVGAISLLAAWVISKIPFVNKCIL